MSDYKDIDRFESTDAALRGALALGIVICEATIGEKAAAWADFVVEDLQGAQHALLLRAREELDALNGELWQAKALLGTYGDEAKSRAEATATEAIA